MIIFSTESKNEPNIAIAGVNLKYIVHTKESSLEKDFEAIESTSGSPTQICSIPSDMIEELLGSLGDLGEDVLQQASAYLRMFMVNYPTYVEKDIIIAGFYEEELWENKRFSLVGNAPPGRRIYLSYYDTNADFTDDYILSTYSNSLGGFAFPTIAAPKGGKVAIWMELKPNDSIGNIKGYFKYWLNYETKDRISSYYIAYNDQSFETSHRRYSNISISLSWSPESFYENNAFLYCIPKGTTPQNVNGLLEPTSQANCLNNIFYAYQKQLRGQPLLGSELQIMTKTFSSFASDFNTKKDSATFKTEESYEGVLAWTYFYDTAPYASINMSISNSAGYIDTVVKIDRKDYVHDNNQCDIVVERSWGDTDSDTEMKILSIDVDESEFDGYSYFIDPTNIEDVTEKERTCIGNLYLAGKKQENGETLTQPEKEILKFSAQTAPFDFTISKSSQRISQRKSFKLSMAWASFYNKLPASRDITIQVQDVTGELKMTGYYINYDSLNRPKTVSASMSWTTADYVNNKAYSITVDALPSAAQDFIPPVNTEQCLANMMLAAEMQFGSVPLTDEQLQILEQSFNGVTGIELPYTGLGVSESQTYVIAWSGFYNHSHPQNPYFSFSYETVCLSGDTLITMADSSKKRLDQMAPGDEVLGQEGTTTVESLKIMPANSFYYIYHFEDGIDIKETSPHRFYNIEQDFSQKLSRWEIGEHALHEDGRHIALLSKERIVGEELKYGLYTKSGTYYANGLLSGPMFVNQPALAEASIVKVVNMVSSIDAARALKFAKTGDY